tara:strand:+ start:3985 stop:4095 length:111 start_codon:yes stop_codon:yes gene_type:complete
MDIAQGRKHFKTRIFCLIINGGFQEGRAFASIEAGL